MWNATRWPFRTKGVFVKFRGIGKSPMSARRPNPAKDQLLLCRWQFKIASRTNLARPVPRQVECVIPPCPMALSRKGRMPRNLSLQLRICRGPGKQLRRMMRIHSMILCIFRVASFRKDATLWVSSERKQARLGHEDLGTHQANPRADRRIFGTAVLESTTRLRTPNILNEFQEKKTA